MEEREQVKKAPYYNNPDKKKGVAVLLWFVGYFGYLNIHNFYLGKVKAGLLKLGILAAGGAVTAAVAYGGGRNGFLAAYIIVAIALMVWNIVELVRISKMGVSAEAAAAARAKAAERAEKQQRSMGWKIVSLFISIFFIIGGLSGDLVLRGTDSSQALIVVGVIYLIVNIVSIANHNKKKGE